MFLSYYDCLTRLYDQTNQAPPPLRSFVIVCGGFAPNYFVVLLCVLDQNSNEQQRSHLGPHRNSGGIRVA